MLTSEWSGADGPGSSCFSSRSVSAADLPRHEIGLLLPLKKVAGEAKFRLTAEVTLATHTGLSASRLREAQSVVEVHIEEVRHAWNHHFGS